MKQLKVYAVASSTKYASGQRRYFAAVKSKKEFAALLDCSVHFLNGYASETGNAVEVPVALAWPGALFSVPMNWGGKLIQHTERTDG